MIRVFLTGDNHIGLKYASHQRADVLAAARIRAFEDMVARANAENCAIFAIAGDLFENTYSITKRDIKQLLDILSCFQGIVAVLPGNHDYYDKDVKLWQYFQDVAAAKDNILLLTEYRPYPLYINDEEVILYPAHCTSLHSEPGKNNLDWIKAEEILPDSTYRLGIAHGAVQGETIDKEGQYFLMTRSELESIPLDAWLIGHTHVPFPGYLTEEFAVTERILNAGTHVQTDVSCSTEGLCFIIELDDSKTLRARKVPTGNLRFFRLAVKLAAGEMEEIVARQLADLPDSSVVELILSGAVTMEEYDRRHEVMEAQLSRFLEGTYSDSALSKLISRELIDAEFSETSLSAHLLTALLEQPKEAQLAYELLKSLKEGK